MRNNKHLEMTKMVRVSHFVTGLLVFSSFLISGISLAATKNSAAEQRLVPKSLLKNAIQDISDSCDNPDEYNAFLKLKETAKKDHVTAKELFGLSDDFMVPLTSDYRKKIGINNLKKCHVAFADIRASFVDFLEGFYSDEDGINFHRFSINFRKLAYEAASRHNVLNKKDVKKLFIPLNKIKILKIYNQKPLPWGNSAQIITKSIFDVQRSHTIAFYEPESIYFFLNVHTVMDAACDTYLNPNTVEYMFEPEWQIVVCEKAKREKEILSFILDIKNKTPEELNSRLEEIETFRSSWDKGAVELRQRYKVLKSKSRHNNDFIEKIPNELEKMHHILKVYIYAELGDTEKLTELYPTVSFFFTPIGKSESMECAVQPITTIAKVQETLLKNKLSYVSLKNSLCKYSPEEKHVTKLRTYPFDKDIQSLKNSCEKLSNIYLYTKLNSAKNKTSLTAYDFKSLADTFFMLELARISKPKYSTQCESSIVQIYEKLGNYYLDVTPKNDKYRDAVSTSLNSLAEYKKREGL